MTEEEIKNWLAAGLQLPTTSNYELVKRIEALEKRVDELCPKRKDLTVGEDSV